ncbi:MAG TPA: gamma-glutamyltransferase, partial [Polyangiaceae bacterium]|nr:gamma-glutamyltransferase [Polyangiaceae bacterium]
RELLNPQRLAARRAKIGSERTHAPPQFELVEYGTTHLSIADAQGNVVALTTTVNDYFGSGVFAPRSGVLLNDELSDFTDPALAARFGAFPNAARGGARPVSSMTPTIFFRDGAPVLAVGGSGGLRIPVNVTQAVVCRLVFGKSASDCVAAPRFHVPPVGPTLAFNPEELPLAAVQLDLLERGEQIKELQGADTTAVQMVGIEHGDAGVQLQAGSDPRKGGAGLVK